MSDSKLINLGHLRDTAETIDEVKADKKTGVFYIEGTGSTAGTWLGTHEDITEYYDGLMIAYRIGVAGLSSKTTLNINNLGAVTVVKNVSSAISTSYAVGSVIFLVYDEDTSGTSYWKIADYDSNYYDRVRMAGNIKAGEAITAASIVVGTGGLYYPLKSGKAFDITYPILFAANAISSGANNTYGYFVYSVTIANTQSLTMTAYKPVYIKGTLEGTTFTPISTTPLTQDVPTTEDGYEYILLGIANSSTKMYLLPEHPVFAYRKGAFGRVSSIKSVSWNDLTKKPFGEETFTEVVASITVSSLEDGNEVALAFLTNGCGYIVTWDDVEYPCTAFMEPTTGFFMLGNGSILNEGAGLTLEDTGEPFVFVDIQGISNLYSDANEHTFSVVQVTESKLDDKYVPPTDIVFAATMPDCYSNTATDCTDFNGTYTDVKAAVDAGRTVWFDLTDSGGGGGRLHFMGYERAYSAYQFIGIYKRNTTLVQYSVMVYATGVIASWNAVGPRFFYATIPTTGWTEDNTTGVKSLKVTIKNSAGAITADHHAKVDNYYNGDGTSDSYTTFVEQQTQFKDRITNGYSETVDQGIKFYIFGDAPTVEIPIIVEVV